MLDAVRDNITILFGIALASNMPDVNAKKADTRDLAVTINSRPYNLVKYAAEIAEYVFDIRVLPERVYNPKLIAYYAKPIRKSIMKEGLDTDNIKKIDTETRLRLFFACIARMVAKLKATYKDYNVTEAEMQSVFQLLDEIKAASAHYNMPNKEA